MAKKGRRPPPRSAGPRGGGKQKLPNVPGMPDVQALMAQAAEMQARVADQQAAMADKTYEGSAGGGMVKAVVIGSGELASVEIDPSVLDPEDAELVGDLVVAAVGQAMSAMREEAAAAMGLPDGLDLGSLDLDDLGGLLG